MLSKVEHTCVALAACKRRNKELKEDVMLDGNIGHMTIGLYSKGRHIIHQGERASERSANIGALTSPKNQYWFSGGQS